MPEILEPEVADAATGADTPALHLQAVTLRFGAQVAVDGLTLAVQRGDIVALLGPNGAGKSTTIALALGFLRPDRGRVLVDGADLADMADKPGSARRRIGYIPEMVNLYPQLSGLENLDYFTALAGMALGDAALRAALAQAGLPAAAHDRRCSTYSKGMRQKVGIAIALARDCRLLLLDEPSSGLDPVAAAEFHAALRQTAGHGVGILMATHDTLLAREVATRMAVMRGGRLVAEGSAASFGDERALLSAYAASTQEGR